MTTFQAYPTGICDWIAVIHLTEKKKKSLFQANFSTVINQHSPTDFKDKPNATEAQVLTEKGLWLKAP